MTYCTHLKHMKLFTRVNAHMSDQVPKFIKPPVANLALIWFLTRVDKLMSLQAAKHMERLVTHFIYMRLLTRMDGHLVEKIAMITE